MFYQCFISVLSVFYQCFISVLSVFYQCFISVLSVLYQCFISVLSVFYKMLINFSNDLLTRKDTLGKTTPETNVRYLRRRRLANQALRWLCHEMFYKVKGHLFLYYMNGDLKQ